MGYKGNIIFPLMRNLDVIFDIGAKSGHETRRFLKLSPNAQVHVFEPLPRWFRYLKKRYGKKPNCHVYNVAVSDKDGIADFYVDPGGSQNASSLRMPTKLSDVTYEKKPLKAQTCKLDTYYNNLKINIIDFMWVDIEGAERELINGGREALKNTKYFYVEYFEKAHYKGQALLPEIIELMTGLNFKILEKFPWFNEKENKVMHFGEIIFKNKNL